VRPIRLLRAFVLVGVLALVAAPAAGAHVRHAGHGHHHGKNIVQTAVAAGDFDTLVSLVKQAGLADTLAHGGPFTVFAPTDEAFAKVPKATLDALAADPALLKKVLLYHVVAGKVYAAQAAKLTSATTVEGEDVQISVTSSGGLKVNDSNVIAADVKASNGVIHAIDSVLLPPSLTPAPAPKNIVDTAVAAGDFTTLVKLLQATGLDAVLAGPGPFTVFAPTDEAFAKVPKATLDALAADPALLKQVLTYHVVAGAVSSADASKLSSATTVEGENVKIKVRDGALYVNWAKVTTPDVAASNGVIHVIDKVLIPPSIAHPAPTKNIVETAVAAGDFTTLVKLLQATGLDAVLAGDGPFTVFAPTDEAFAKLPKATLDALAADPALLKKVLLYHVVSGKVLARDAAKAGSATTVEGDTVTFSKGCRHHKHHTLRVNDANVIAADVLATNGVIHVIDKVLVPPTG
jgi:transforming growth factor-beta-induced protein